MNGERGMMNERQKPDLRMRIKAFALRVLDCTVHFRKSLRLKFLENSSSEVVLQLALNIEKPSAPAHVRSS